MSGKHKAYETDAPYFTTFTLVEWIPLFAIPEFATIIVDSLKYCAGNTGLLIYGYCIMTSHIHLIVQSNSNPLGSTIRDLKKYTAAQIDLILKNYERYQDHL